MTADGDKAKVAKVRRDLAQFVTDGPAMATSKEERRELTPSEIAKEHLNSPLGQFRLTIRAGVVAQADEHNRIAARLLNGSTE